MAPQDVKKAEEKKDTKKTNPDADLSEEDQKLKEDLNLLVQRLTEDDQSLYKPALENLRVQIRASTTSMTAVPKPLKFLMPHYETIKQIYEKIVDPTVKTLCADVISVLAMTMGTDRDCLKYRLLSPEDPVGTWGHEYVRHIAAELMVEWEKQAESSKDPQLLKLVKDVVAHHMAHNAEIEAIDLLMELELLNIMEDFVDEHTQPRVCLYLISLVPLAAEPQNTELLNAAYRLYIKFDKQIDAVKIALMSNDRDSVRKILESVKDVELQRQIAILLGRQQVFIDLTDDFSERTDLTELINNTTTSQNFLALARELDIMEPKTPEDIYKSHLEPTRPFAGAGTVDSAKQNLASSFVNGLINCGFGCDKLLAPDPYKWFYKNKDQGIMSAAASQGMLHRWSIDNGLTAIDKFLYVTEDYIKAGSLLAIGVISSGVQHDCDPAAALLLDYVSSEKSILRIGSILGLGLAYANSTRDSAQNQVIPQLLAVFDDPKATPEVLGLTGLALGFICVGTGNPEPVVQKIMTCLYERPDLTDPGYRWLALAIGLVYLTKQEAGGSLEIIMQSLEALPKPFSGFATTLLTACAYTGTGNVLKIQHMLNICYQKLQTKDDKEKEKDKKKKAGASSSSASNNNNNNAELPDGWLEQAAAVLGVSLISFGEDIGKSMSFRTFGLLLRYGDVWIRRAVPLALAMSFASNPELNVTEALLKFSHDSDAETAATSIFSMGIVAAGTNNARTAANLRQLAAFHQRDTNALFMVRLAQGLVHMGKGTMTVSPFHSDRQLLCLPAVAGMLATMIGCLDIKQTILGKQHYLLFNLVPAIQPRMLMTFETDANDELKQINVPVRVGQAVDVVGQAGKPKTITGFQTHTTPVLLGYEQRAELATEEYLPVSPILEGFVILKKNPEYKEKL